MQSSIDFLKKHASNLWINALNIHFQTAMENNECISPFQCVFLESEDWDQVQSKEMEGVTLSILSLGGLFGKIGKIHPQAYKDGVLLMKNYPFDELEKENNDGEGNMIVVLYDSSNEDTQVLRVRYEEEKE